MLGLELQVESERMEKGTTVVFKVEGLEKGMRACSDYRARKEGAEQIPIISPLTLIWVVVKIMVTFWIPIITLHLIFRVPKKGP